MLRVLPYITFGIFTPAVVIYQLSSIFPPVSRLFPVPAIMLRGSAYRWKEFCIVRGLVDDFWFLANTHETKEELVREIHCWNLTQKEVNYLEKCIKAAKGSDVGRIPVRFSGLPSCTLSYVEGLDVINGRASIRK